MSDPLSVTASIVGIVGALLHGSKRLYEFIDSLQNAPKDIAALSTDLRALYEILAHVTNIQDRLSSHVDLCTSLKVPLENCLNIFDEFSVLLQGFTQTSKNGTMQVRVWKQMAWAFKDKEIQLFRDTITTYKVSLDMALSAMTFSTIASLNERTKRFETDFKEEFRDIKSRLQALDNDRVELASVVGCKGSEWYGTEADFAMKRFLEYTESLCDSPPASFPGSPIQPLSEGCDELDTQQALTDTATSRQLNDTNNIVPSTGEEPAELHIEIPRYQIQLYSRERFYVTGQKSRRGALEGIEQTMTFERDFNRAKGAYLDLYLRKAQIPSGSADLTTSRLKDVYNTSGFDAVKMLWLVITRKNPQFNIGQIDMSCSFVVCDITLEDCPIVYVSDSFQTLTGYSRHEALGRNCRFLQSPNGKVDRSSPRLFVDNGTVYSLKNSVKERRETQVSMINYRNGVQPFLNFLSIIPIPWDTDEVRYYVGFQIDLIQSPIALALRNV